MKIRVILALALLVLLISCAGEVKPTEEMQPSEPAPSMIPPPPEVEPPAYTPYEQGNTTG